MGKLFGTDGIRGIVNEDLTNELAMQIGMAAAEVLIKHRNEGATNGTVPTVMIGRDTRASGDMIEAALTAGFCAVGVNVLAVGVIPTPGIAYLIGKYNCDVGVMISASHNPCEYNGIKFFQKSGYKLPDAVEDEIEAIIFGGMQGVEIKTGADVGRRTYSRDAVEDYINHVVSVATVSFEGLNIALDTANGSASVSAKEIFTRLHAKCHMLSDVPNGSNINLDCGSTHLEELQHFVKINKLDMGLAFDGDADRMLAVDENGEVVDGDKVMAICASQMKAEGTLKKNTVVSTVMSNLGFFKYCKENDINCARTAVGDRYVLERMLQKGYNIGGEQSGHVIFLDHATTGDGELSGVKLIEAVVKSGKTLKELADKITTYPQVLINVEVTPEGKRKYSNDEYIISAVQEAEMELGGDGRVLIRVSGTEPLIRIMLEGSDTEKITELGNGIAEVVRDRLK